MATVNADVLGEAAAMGQEVNEVARNDADCGMPDLAPHLRLLQKRMAAEAGVLLESVARRDVARAMAEQAAEIPHFLLERRRRRIRILFSVEQQRMPALRADVFVTTVAIGELLVIVLAEEARQRMPHARERLVFSQILGAAAAPPRRPLGLLEDVIVDVMPPQETRQSGECLHAIPLIRNVQEPAQTAHRAC